MLKVNLIRISHGAFSTLVLRHPPLSARLSVKSARRGGRGADLESRKLVRKLPSRRSQGAREPAFWGMCRVLNGR
eukprot:5412544-Pyramimonas_sp.AAC.2